MESKPLIIVLVLLVVLVGFLFYYSLKIPGKGEISIEKEEFVTDSVVKEEKKEIKEQPIIFEEPKENNAIIEITTKFTPDELDITPGTTVVWINNDTRPHQVYAAIPGTPFFSGRLMPGDKYEYTFNDLGVYKYGDSIFKALQGKIRVTETPPITGSFIGPQENQAVTGIVMIVVIFVILGTMFEIHKK